MIEDVGLFLLTAGIVYVWYRCAKWLYLKYKGLMKSRKENKK